VRGQREIQRRELAEVRDRRRVIGTRGFLGSGEGANTLMRDGSGPTTGFVYDVDTAKAGHPDSLARVAVILVLRAWAQIVAAIIEAVVINVIRVARYFPENHTV
jgi:hypothetical protein